jgi:hypothetical protein
MTKKTFENAVSAVLAGADPDKVADQVLTEAAPTPDRVEATPEPKAEKKETIGSVVAGLVMDVSLSYDMIVNMIHAQFDNASTSARSVASIAARLRKTCVDVPHRRKAKAAE